MADITMCKGTKCRVKARCYRFVAKPDDMWQSWFDRVPKRKPCNFRIKCQVTESGVHFPEGSPFR